MADMRVAIPSTLPSWVSDLPVCIVQNLPTNTTSYMEYSRDIHHMAEVGLGENMKFMARKG